MWFAFNITEWSNQHLSVIWRGTTTTAVNSSLGLSLLYTLEQVHPALRMTVGPGLQCRHLQTRSNYPAYPVIPYHETKPGKKKKEVPENTSQLNTDGCGTISSRQPLALNVFNNSLSYIRPLSFLFVWFFKTVSLCSPGCPRTYSVDQTGLKLTEICLPLSP